MYYQYLSLLMVFRRARVARILLFLLLFSLFFGLFFGCHHPALIALLALSPQQRCQETALAPVDRQQLCLGMPRLIDTKLLVLGVSLTPSGLLSAVYVLQCLTCLLTYVLGKLLRRLLLLPV